MEHHITPPNSWNGKCNSNKICDIYDKIMQGYKEHEILFKVIKNDGEIKNLTKNICINYSKFLANQITNTIKGHGQIKQLKILGIMSASEESVILMLSSLLIGAHHSICFEDLSDESIISRIKIFMPNIVLCKIERLERLKKVLGKYKLLDLPILGIDLNKAYNLNSLSNNFKKYNEDSNLFTLFTSGSTGSPKAVTHGTKEYIDYAQFTTSYFFGVKKGSIIFTATDAGWINGHTYAFYGPLLLGATSIIIENPILISLPRQLGELFEKVQPNCFYTSVTVLRLLKSAIKPKQTISDFCKVNLKIERIGSCGEPLANSVGSWAINFFETKRRSIVNTYFQTETGGILCAPRDEDIPPKDYSCVGKPRKELQIKIASDIMTSYELQAEGVAPDEILVCNYWGGIFRKIISDKESKYFTNSGYFRLHDIGYIDKEGYLYITGRSDDVINVAGHRISSSEIESTCLELIDIDEACAVSVSDSFYGSKVVLYFSSHNFQPNHLHKTKSNLKDIIKQKLTKYHIPKEIHFFKNLPKTKSGKIIRRIMRSIAEDHLLDESHDYSTLANKDKFLESIRTYQRMYIPSVNFNQEN